MTINLRKIETKRLQIRPMQMRDDRAWFAAHAAMLPTKGAWEIPRVPLNEINYPRFVADILETHRAERDADKKYTLGIFHKEAGSLLGFVWFEDIDREKSSATLDFRIFNIHWKKGFAKEAVDAALSLKKTLKIKNQKSSNCQKVSG